MQHTRIHSGMTIAYKREGQEGLFFGVVLHVGLSVATKGTVWLRELDHMGNAHMQTIHQSQIIQVLIGKGANI